MIFTSFFKALAQVGDPRFRSVLWRGIGLTLALFAGAYLVVLGILQWWLGDSVVLPLIGEVQWLDDVAGWGSLLLMLIFSAFLMVPVASAITSMYLDRVAQAVEDRHYPQLPEAAKVTFVDAVRDTFSFLGILIGVNILALVLYMVLSPIALLLFWGINGYLLGLEYFQMVAMRRVGRVQAKVLRQRNLPVIWSAGILMALPLSIPILNLFIPILGAATFTHIFHRLNR